MSGVSEMVVMVAIGAMVLLGMIVGWWLFRRMVSFVWRTVLTVVVLIVVAGVAAYVYYARMNDTPLPFGLDAFLQESPSEQP
jgi:hypothetical protein